MSRYVSEVLSPKINSSSGLNDDLSVPNFLFALISTLVTFVLYKSKLINPVLADISKLEINVLDNIKSVRFAPAEAKPLSSFVFALARLTDFNLVWLLKSNDSN